jgi:hypothetical protein
MKLASLILAAGVAFATPALAEPLKVYEWGAGVWNLDGFIDPEIDDAYCILSTTWNDGTKLKVNMFLNNRNYGYSTLTVSDPSWDFSGYDRSKAYKTKVTLFMMQNIR